MGADADHEGEETFDVYLRAKGQADDAVRDSGLDYVIVRPGMLTDDPPTGKVEAGESVERGEIPRADVAAVIARCSADGAPARDARGRRRADADRANPGGGLARAGLERRAHGLFGCARFAGRGSSRPAAATVQSIVSQVAVATAMWTQTSAGRQLERPLDAADRGLQRDQADHHRQRAERPAVAAVADEDEPDGDRGDAEDRGHDRVPLDDPLQRVGALEVEALDELAVVIAGMRAGGGA